MYLANGFVRRYAVVPGVCLALFLAGCGSSGGSASAASAASKLGAGLAAQASAVQSAVATSPATTASSASASATTTASASAAASAATAVLVKTDPKLGQILTDPSGRTLYWFTKDKVGVSNCSGACLGIWPPFTPAGTLTLPAGVPGKLTTITRTDGSTQVAYDGMPLYYYSKDTNPGDTSGEGVLKSWYVVTPTAGPLTPPAA